MLKFKLFRSKKPQVQPVQKSSPCLALSPKNSIIGYLMGSGNTELYTYQAIDYYSQVSPLFTAIDILSIEFRSLRPVVFDSKTDQYIYDDPILEPILHPNPEDTKTKFLEQLAAYLNLTGNVFVSAIGNINRPPLELWVVPPQEVTILPDSENKPGTIVVNTPGESIQFTKQEIDGRYRFINGDGREIYHIKFFNPRKRSVNFFGTSKLSPAWYDIEQYLYSGIHNLSLLKRGGTQSGIIKSKTEMPEDTLDRLRVHLQNCYGGADNAGKYMLLQGDLDVISTSITNKDMDFATLKKTVENAMYNVFRIPLPLISEEHSTMSNMAEAKINLYDNAVLPLASFIFEDLTEFLRPRYDNFDQKRITYNESDISALEPRRTEKVKNLKESGVLMINELRAELGYEPVDDGNVIMGSTSDVPIASDTQTEDDESKPTSTKKEFENILKMQVDGDGKRKFSDEEIKKLSIENGFTDEI